MTEILEDNFINGGLLLLILWLDARHLSHVIDRLVESASPFVRRCAAVLHLVVRTGLAMFAVAVLVDPLVSGAALMDVQAPTNIPTTIENLRVRVEPIGYHGPAGAVRTVFTAFTAAGVASINVNLAQLETRLRIDVFDITRSDINLRTTTVHVSPLVRRQLLSLYIDWEPN